MRAVTGWKPDGTLTLARAHQEHAGETDPSEGAPHAVGRARAPIRIVRWTWHRWARSGRREGRAGRRGHGSADRSAGAPPRRHRAGAARRLESAVAPACAGEPTAPRGPRDRDAGPLAARRRLAASRPAAGRRDRRDG